MDKILKNLRIKIYDLFKDENTGHDISHLERVFNNALEIQKVEGGDLYIIAISALVHDIHRLMSKQAKKYISPEESLDNVRKILIDCKVDESKLDKILSVVKNHENKDNKNFSLETLILQDADALDSIGEIGLERTLLYCKAHNIPLKSDIPLDCSEYIPNINPISTCHYIYRTMIPIKDYLYTTKAKELAKDKTKILEEFIKNNLSK